MSLIEQALRRINDPVVSPAPAQSPPAGKPQTQREPAPQPRAPAPAQPDAQSAASAATGPSLMLVGAAVLALTIVLVIGGAFWLGRALGPGIQSAATSPSAIAPAVRPALAPAAASAPSAQAPASAAEAALTPIADTPLLALPWKARHPARAEEELHLSGVVEGMGEAYAVINGVIVGPGERVGDYTLVKVANGAATVRARDGSDTVLRVPR